MKIAILHPWFTMRGGGERVMDVMAGMFPSADFFSLFCSPDQLSPEMRNRRITASMLNKLPGARRFHRQLLPFYPWAVESFDLREYDLVISSCGPAMMGAAVRQDALHICYCHTPQRMWWDLYAEHQAMLKGPQRLFFTAASNYNRIFEFCAMQRVDSLVSNSRFIDQRIQKYFRRSTTVIYPPVNVSKGYISDTHEDYYLYVGRLEIQKRVDLIIEACNRLKRRLLLSGTGREEPALRAMAGPTVQFLGRVPDAEIGALFARSRAFLFPAVEDFGIAPVEAQSYGRPVIAYGYSGNLETISVGSSDGKADTGIFFPRQQVDDIISAILEFERREGDFDPRAIQEHSRTFQTSAFVDEFGTHINNFLARHGRGPAYLPAAEL
jgi:glycosyltransferase involved in cell wall biosynthesis